MAIPIYVHSTTVLCDCLETWSGITLRYTTKFMLGEFIRSGYVCMYVCTNVVTYKEHLET